MKTSTRVARWVALGAVALSTAACGASESPVITSVDPDASTVGTTITIRGRGFQDVNDVGFELANAQYSAGFISGAASADGETIVFHLPDALGACPFTQMGPDDACPAIGLGLPDGYTKLFVVTEAGESNRVAVTVTAPQN